MKPNLYVNTGKIGSVVGLIVTTIALSYVSTNATKIVEGTASAVKNGVVYLKNHIEHGNKKQYAVWRRDLSGKLYDTGQRLWK